MSEIVGVRLQSAGKVYYFEAADIPLEIDDDVVVETSRGHELGKVVISPKQVIHSEITEPLKPVIRKALAEDIERANRQQERAKNAIAKCRELIEKLSLSMKPIWAQYNLDGSHLTIFFSAEKRVDFRELVRELSRSLKTRVELRQVGARDEAKLVGGLGKCGCPLCCTTFLSEFAPVSIKMAKEQDITLNPMKTSGICGRLLCCLGYEYEQYRTMKEKMPALRQEVSTALGNAKVVSCNPIKETVTVELETGSTVELPLGQIRWQTKPEGDSQQTKPSSLRYVLLPLSTNTEVLERHVESVTMWLSRLAKEWHPSLDWCSAGLAAVTRYAGTYHIFPAMFATAPPRRNMI